MTIHTCALQENKCYIMDVRPGGTRGSIDTQIGPKQVFFPNLPVKKEIIKIFVDGNSRLVKISDEFVKKCGQLTPIHTCLEEIFGSTSKPPNDIYIICINSRKKCSELMHFLKYLAELFSRLLRPNEAA